MLLDHEDNGAANDAHNLLQALGALAPPWIAEIHEAVIASKIAPWVKASAAEQLALGGDAPTAERYVLAWLDHPELATYAPEIVATLGAKANTPAIIARLRAELGTEVLGKRLEGLLNALVALGAQDTIDLDQFTSQVEGWRRFDLVVRSKRIAAPTMLEYLDRAELIPAAGHDTRTRFAEGWGKDDTSETIAGLLHEGGRSRAFDLEDACTPPDYPVLVGELVALSNGEIVISKVSVSAKPTMLEMELTTDALTVLVRLQHQGDWIDVDGLLSGLNQLLTAAGSSKRYYPLVPSGQFALVVLARADAMTPLVSDLRFPIGEPHRGTTAGAGV